MRTCDFTKISVLLSVRGIDFKGYGKLLCDQIINFRALTYQEIFSEIESEINLVLAD